MAWQPTPVFLPGGSHGQRSLEGYSPWGCKASDMSDVSEHACSHIHGERKRQYLVLNSKNWNKWLFCPQFKKSPQWENRLKEIKKFCSVGPVVMSSQFHWRGHRLDPGSGIPWSGRSPGIGNGNPLQYTCLEDPMDRGAWRTIVDRVTHSQTLLKWLSIHACIINVFMSLYEFILCPFKSNLELQFF